MREHSAQILQSNRLNAKGLPVDAVQSYSTVSVPELRKVTSSTSTVVRDAVIMRSAPPFIASHDLLRGIVYGGRAALQFAFMLAIMYVFLDSPVPSSKTDLCRQLGRSKSPSLCLLSLGWEPGRRSSDVTSAVLRTSLSHVQLLYTIVRTIGARCTLVSLCFARSISVMELVQLDL